MMAKLIDLTGKQFGKLKVLKKGEINEDENTYWVCECECGNLRNVRSYTLRTGRVVSCGCNREKNKVKHGGFGTRLYSCWMGMKRRCTNNEVWNKKWESYGGRGISIHDEWVDDFVPFKTWALKNGYQDDLTLDRIDVDGNYNPNNCKWSTPKEQQNNRRINRKVTIDKETKNISEWADFLGINRSTVYSRIKLGWNDVDAITIPVRRGDTIGN